MTPLILLFLAAMWAAVLLPSYLRGRGVGGSGSGVFAAARERIGALGAGSSGYLPVGGDLGPQQNQTPLPHGARYPVGSGPKAMRTSPTYRPTSGSVKVLGESTNAIEILGPVVDPDPTGPRATVHELRPRQERRLQEQQAARHEADSPAPGSFVDEFGVVHDARGRAQRPARTSTPSARRPTPSGAGTPQHVMTRRAARKRRRDVFHALLGSTGVTFLLAVVMGGPFLLLFLLSGAALAGFVVMLLQVQKSEAERDIKVAFLPHGGEGVAPSQLLRQAGGEAF